MQLVHQIGTSVSLHVEGREAPMWRYVYSGVPKPYFHPICTPAGHVLTILEPHDHYWHRGLWFTFKFINGENFWEEHEPFGTQRTVEPPGINHGGDGRINLFTRLEWVRPDGGDIVIREQRQISHLPLGEDAYAIDFYTNLVAQADLKLDRTPYTTWGGYGGLIFRATRNWHAPKHLLPDGSMTERPTGAEAAWCALSGKLDGGRQQTGGFAMFDHPSNPRHPTPWYGAGTQMHSYLNAAILFHEPMDLGRGETLTLRYRVVLHDGLWDVARLQSAYNDYITAREQ
jgi:hypothetical protein